MAALTEGNDFPEELLRIETTTPVLGGESGPLNAAAKALGARTRWLRTTLLGRALADILAVGASAGNHEITNLGSPTAPGSAARKADVDAVAAALAAYVPPKQIDVLDRKSVV